MKIEFGFRSRVAVESPASAVQAMHAKKRAKAAHGDPAVRSRAGAAQGRASQGVTPARRCSALQQPAAKQSTPGLRRARQARPGTPQRQPAPSPPHLPPVARGGPAEGGGADTQRRSAHQSRALSFGYPSSTASLCFSSRRARKFVNASVCILRMLPGIVLNRTANVHP